MYENLTKSCIFGQKSISIFQILQTQFCVKIRIILGFNFHAKIFQTLWNAPKSFHSRSRLQVYKMLAKHDSIEVKESPGKGRGIFCVKTIKEGQKIFTESPTVIGPKQTSPFVCVDCFDYIDEQTGKNRLMGI